MSMFIFLSSTSICDFQKECHTRLQTVRRRQTNAYFEGTTLHKQYSRSNEATLSARKKCFGHTLSRVSIQPWCSTGQICEFFVIQNETIRAISPPIGEHPLFWTCLGVFGSHSPRSRFVLVQSHSTKFLTKNLRLASQTTNFERFARAAASHHPRLLRLRG